MKEHFVQKKRHFRVLIAKTKHILNTDVALSGFNNMNHEKFAIYFPSDMTEYIPLLYLNLKFYLRKPIKMLPVSFSLLLQYFNSYFLRNFLLTHYLMHFTSWASLY